MADTKITALTALTAADPANDVIPIVDVSDTSMAASGTTKKISVNNILSSSPTASGALTVTGLVTAGSATITGAATVGTTLGVTGVSTLASANVTNNLGVGGSVNYTGATEFYLQNSAGTNFIGIHATSNYIRFATNNAIKATIDSSGNFNMQSGNVVMTTSGKGIDFSATTEGSGTMTSELLNDYEEGTFTPTVIGTTTAGTVTYARQLGRYTKVGNLVTVQIYLSWSAGTGTGNLAFGGLPFTIANNANEYASVAIGQFDGIALTASNVPSIIGSPNTTIFNVNQFPVGGGANAAVAYDGAGAIIMTSTYIA